MEKGVIKARVQKHEFIINILYFMTTGLTADARVLSRFMRTECLNEQFAHNQALALNKLMERVGAKMQIATQRYDKRPYGVGLLVAGYDVSIYQV